MSHVPDIPTPVFRPSPLRILHRVPRRTRRRHSSRLGTHCRLGPLASGVGKGFWQDSACRSFRLPCLERRSALGLGFR